MSITAHKLCNQNHHTCSKSKSSWTLRCGASFMDIHSLGAYLPHMAGLGVAICSYNILGIWMYVGQNKQFLGTPHKYRRPENLCTVKWSGMRLSQLASAKHQWPAMLSWHLSQAIGMKYPTQTFLSDVQRNQASIPNGKHYSHYSLVLRHELKSNLLM